MKKTFEQFFLSEEDTFTDPNNNPDAYTNQDVTFQGGGRVGNYPVSQSSFNWLKTKSGAFTAGFLSVYTESEVEQIFLGSTLSASYYKEQYYLYDVTLANEAQAAQDAYFDYFTDVWQPELAASQARVNAFIAAENYQAALAEQNRFDDLYDDELDRLNAVWTAKVNERSAVLSNLSDYLKSGKITEKDPYRLDDPTVAAALRKKRRNEEIDRQIEELKKDNERLKSQQAIRAVQTIVGLGFDIATAIAILNVFTGPADEAAIISGRIGANEILERMAREGGKEVVERGIQKAAQKIPTQLADDAAGVTEKLLRSKGSLGDDAVVKMVNKIDDALDSGSVDAVKKVMQQADDLLYGRVTPKPRVSTPTPKPKPSRYKIDPKRSNPQNYPSNPRNLSNSYEPSGKVLSEDRRFQILKEIKKPFVVPELPKKYKMNFAGKYSAQNTPDKTASQVTDALVASGNAKGQRWRQKDKDWLGYETTERMNVVYDKVGHGDQYWKMIVGDNVRKKKDRELQEKLNIVAHEKALMQENPNYEAPFNKKHIDEQETLSADKDPLFKKVSKSLKKSIDYPDKPAKAGYPNDPPPKMINGYHPDLVNGQKVSKYYNRLDPTSAMAMPPTGNPHIDKKVRAAAKGKDKTFKEFWVPITGNGPTNSASQTFAFGDPESGIEYTVNGLGGQTYPSGTEVFGDPVPTPDYSQLAMQGYTPPLSNEVMKRDKQDENLKKIKDTLKKLGTSWEEMRANNWAIVRPDGTSIVLEPIEPGRGQLNWIDNSKITVGRKHRDAEPDQNPYKITNPDGSITMEFSEIVSVTEFRVGDELNKQLDASEKFTKEIDADEFMKGRVTDTTKPAPKFTDTDVSISPEDEQFIANLSTLPHMANLFSPGSGTAGTLALQYAKGDMTPVTKSPGDDFDRGVLNMIDRSIAIGNVRGDVQDNAYSGDISNAMRQSPIRASLGQFNYEINSSGIRVVDTFNFNDNDNIGFLKIIPGLQGVATRLVDIGNKRAILNGVKDPSKNYGIPIKYTIPWNKVPQELQNKLDPTATIIPTTKRRRKRVQESTWGKLKKRRGS